MSSRYKEQSKQEASKRSEELTLCISLTLTKTHKLTHTHSYTPSLLTFLSPQRLFAVACANSPFGALSQCLADLLHTTAKDFALVCFLDNLSGYDATETNDVEENGEKKDGVSVIE